MPCGKGERLFLSRCFLSFLAFENHPNYSANFSHPSVCVFTLPVDWERGLIQQAAVELTNLFRRHIAHHTECCVFVCVCVCAVSEKWQLAKKNIYIYMYIFYIFMHQSIVFFSQCTQLPNCHFNNTTIIKAGIIYPKGQLVIFIKSIADNSLVMLAATKIQTFSLSSVALYMRSCVCVCVCEKSDGVCSRGWACYHWDQRDVNKSVCSWLKAHMHTYGHAHRQHQITLWLI